MLHRLELGMPKMNTSKFLKREVDAPTGDIVPAYGSPEIVHHNVSFGRLSPPLIDTVRLLLVFLAFTTDTLLRKVFCEMVHYRSLVLIDTLPRGYSHKHGYKN